MFFFKRTIAGVSFALAVSSFLQPVNAIDCHSLKNEGKCIYHHTKCAWDDTLNQCLTVTEEANLDREGLGDEATIVEIRLQSTGSKHHSSCRNRTGRQCEMDNRCIWDFRSDVCEKFSRRLLVELTEPKRNLRALRCDAHSKERLCNEDPNCIWYDEACEKYKDDGFCSHLPSIRSCAKASARCDWDERRDICVTLKSGKTPRSFGKDFDDVPDEVPALSSATSCTGVDNQEDCGEVEDCIWAQNACVSWSDYDDGEQKVDFGDVGNFGGKSLSNDKYVIEDDSDDDSDDDDDDADDDSNDDSDDDSDDDDDDSDDDSNDDSDDDSDDDDDDSDDDDDDSDDDDDDNGISNNEDDWQEDDDSDDDDDDSDDDDDDSSGSMDSSNVFMDNRGTIEMMNLDGENELKACEKIEDSYACRGRDDCYFTQETGCATVEYS